MTVQWSSRNTQHNAV